MHDMFKPVIPARARKTRCSLGVKENNESKLKSLQAGVNDDNI